MEYYLFKPQILINVSHLVSVHYFEYSKMYRFDGEAHDFWEFLYVDKGEVLVTANGKEQTISAGEMIFHAPNEFHTVCTNGVTAPNLVVVSFVCKDETMNFFNSKTIKIDESSRRILAKIIDEAKTAFSSPLGDPTTNRLVRSETSEFASEQMIIMSLSQLLIHFIRKGEKKLGTDTSMHRISTINSELKNDILTRIKRYLEDRIDRQLSIAEICKDNSVGRSYVQKIFHEATGGGVIEYFGELKTTETKRLIREGDYNFTEISEMLGFNSVQYFSRFFKKSTGMTPTEYALSVKAIEEKKE